MPCFDLTWVEPDTGERANVFGNPHEERSKKRGEKKRHTALVQMYLIVHFCFPENNEGVGEECIAEVIEKVVGEEVEVNEYRENPEMVIRREVLIRKFEEYKRTRDIASDC